MYIVYTKKKEHIFLPDGKKFNLDALYGFRYYWYNLWRVSEILSKRSMEKEVCLYSLINNSSKLLALCRHNSTLSLFFPEFFLYKCG